MGAPVPRLVPKVFYSLHEAVEEIGKRLFPDEWTGEEADARALPPPDEGARLVQERAQLKAAARKAGLKDYWPYDLVNPPPPPPTFGGGAGMAEPNTPLDQLQRRLRDTGGIDGWPEIRSSEYEAERAACLRWIEAGTELIEALREGFAEAFIRQLNGCRIRLSPTQWRDQSSYCDVRTSVFGRIIYERSDPLRHENYCEISAESLRRLLDFGESTTSESLTERTAADSEYHTGFPGRPSLRSAVIRLAEERERDGKAEKSVVAEARALEREIKRLCPNAPQHPTARTIETHVRDVRQRLRNESAKS